MGVGFRLPTCEFCLLVTKRAEVTEDIVFSVRRHLGREFFGRLRKLGLLRSVWFQWEFQ